MRGTAASCGGAIPSRAAGGAGRLADHQGRGDAVPGQLRGKRAHDHGERRSEREGDRRGDHPAVSARVYLPLYQTKRARANGADAYAAQTAETRARVLAAAEGAGRESGRDLGTVFLRDNHAYSVTAQGDSVRFEAFSCPVDVAIQVLALLAKPAETQADDEEAGS